jgi:hypothetical protein
MRKYDELYAAIKKDRKKSVEFRNTAKFATYSRGTSSKDLSFYLCSTYKTPGKKIIPKMFQFSY